LTLVDALQQQPPPCSRSYDLPDRKDVCTDTDNDDISSVGDSGITSIAHVECPSPTSSFHAPSQDPGEFLAIFQSTSIQNPFEIHLKSI